MADYSDAYRKDCCSTDKGYPHAITCKRNPHERYFKEVSKDLNYEVFMSDANLVDHLNCLLCFCYVDVHLFSSHRTVCYPGRGKHAKR